MPIVLNGSGTITGVSVGGLPDGIVDTDMIANSNVTAGKLASGVGGKVLQYKVAKKNDTASSAATTMVEISPDLRVTITPTSASNLIVIQAQLTANGYGNYGCAAMIKKNTASDFSGTTSNVYEPSTFTAATHGNTIMFGYINGYMQSTLVQVYETAGNTTARTYSPFYHASATSTIYLNQYGTGYMGTSTMIVMEVAA
tara:strand:+ start:653 stop:1249 length:597 start_codon:yes stop_codon:yes gene_type:complete